MNLILSVFVLVIFICMIIEYSKKLKCNERFLEFIHIPKTAGTTIENVANENNVKWGRFKPEHNAHKNNKRCVYWHTPPKHFGNDSFFKKDSTFCVFRNPYDRLVSEFKYRNRDETQHTKENLNKWILEHLEPKYYADGELECHFIPQHEFIYDDNGNITCDNILNFDNLTDEFNNLATEHEIPFQLSDSRKDNKTPDSLSVDDLTYETKVKIRNIYDKDFNLLYKKL